MENSYHANVQDSEKVTQPEDRGFTPGPWHKLRHEDSDSITICTAPDGHWRICFMATPGGSPGAMERIEADADLICAATDMYEALKVLAGHAGEGMLFSDRLALARAAIAKAEGKSPSPQSESRTDIPTETNS